MSNPWEVKNRPHWKVDPRFTEFNKKIFNEIWDFEDTYKIVQFDKYLFSNNHDRKQILESMKLDWLKYVNEWNRMENISVIDKAKGFVAICYFFMVIPYDKLDSVAKYFTSFEANNINIVYFYNTGYEYISFADTEELFNSGPVHPGAYREWLDDKYNHASWWISYMVYEKINGFAPIINSSPASLK
jgi:hypothetical protein